MTDDTALVIHADASLALAGNAADTAAAQHVFADYRSRKATRTCMSQDDDLARFAIYLGECRIVLDGSALGEHPEGWRGLSWGIVKGFVQWQVHQGFAIASVNRALSTIKTYAKLALHAGAITVEAYALIKTVGGYSVREGKRIDEGRDTKRTGRKKALITSITHQQAKSLKTQPDTPQGRRDALLMCLLLDHGLRVGEIEGLTVEGFDIKAGVFTFYRPKVDKEQTHRLTADTLSTLLAYLANDAPQTGRLLRASRKDDTLTDGTMSTRALNARVGVLGVMVGLATLSPHDCRHYWATAAVRGGTDLKKLQDAGGWNSLAMPARYVESQRIANDNVTLG